MHERHKLMRKFACPKNSKKEEVDKHFPSQNPKRFSQANFFVRRFYLLCNFKQAGSGEFSPIKIAFMGGVIFI